MTAVRRLFTRRTSAVVLVALMMVLAGCGGGGGGDGGAEGTAGTAETTAGGDGSAETTAAEGEETTTAAGGEDGMADNESDMGANATEGNASLRVAHMSPDAPAVDVYLDNETALEDVEFGDVSEYLTVPTGDHQVTITAAGDREAVVFDDTVTLDAATYTVAATGEISENASEPFAPLILEDETNPPAENATVRLAHVSPDAGPVDVTVEGTDLTLFDNATFGNATEYAEVPAGEYTLEVRPATPNDDGEVLTTFDVAVENGTAYTAFAAGYLDPENAPSDEAQSFDLITVTDGQATDLRVAHLSPDAPAVDVYLDNETVVEGAEFGDVSEYLPTTPGDHQVTITAAGDREAVVFDDTVSFEGGDYTVAAIGEIGENASQEFQPLILRDDTSMASENASAVRVVHASPDAPPVDVTVEESGDVLVDDLAFGNATEYAEVPGGEYTLEVRPATPNNDGEVVTTFDVAVENDTAYTAFAVGYLDPENAPSDEAFDLIVVTDAEGSADSEDSASESRELVAPAA